MVISLPNFKSTAEPYNASCINLGTILQKTTKGCIIKRLLRWHIEVKEGDIVAAVKHLQDSQVDVLQSILTHSKRFDYFVNVACNEALRQKKKNFVVLLIKKGATPPQEQLCKMGELLGDPVVLRYLMSSTRLEKEGCFEGMVSARGKRG